MRDINTIIDRLIDAMGEGDAAAERLSEDRADIVHRDEYCAPEYRPEWQRLQIWLGDHCLEHPARDRLVAIFNDLE